jgi:hypothetical protein
MIEDRGVTRSVWVPHDVRHTDDLIGHLQIGIVPIWPMLRQAHPMERIREPRRHLAENVGIDPYRSSCRVLLAIEVCGQYLVQRGVMQQVDIPRPRETVLGDKTLLRSWMVAQTRPRHYEQLTA